MAKKDDEKGRFISKFHGRGTIADTRPLGGVGAQNKMMTSRQNVDYKLLAISVTIVTVFMILFLPRLVKQKQIYYTTTQNQDSNFSVVINLLPGSRSFDPRIHSLCSIVTWFNSMVNPIIYCFLNARFRKEYKKILRIRWQQDSIQITFK